MTLTAGIYVPAVLRVSKKDKIFRQMFKISGHKLLTFAILYDKIKLQTRTYVYIVFRVGIYN